MTIIRRDISFPNEGDIYKACSSQEGKPAIHDDISGDMNGFQISYF